MCHRCFCGKKADYFVKIESSDDYKFAEHVRCEECKIRAENSYDNIQIECLTEKEKGE